MSNQVVFDSIEIPPEVVIRLTEQELQDLQEAVVAEQQAWCDKVNNGPECSNIDELINQTPWSQFSSC
jgi:hypothetical protein